MVEIMTGWTKEDYEQFQGLRATAQANHKLLTALTAHMEKIMAILDSEVALLTTIDTNVQTVISEIQALKAANPTVDTTALDAAIAKLQADVATAATDAAPATAAPPATGSAS